jgi:hypothetical protein
MESGTHNKENLSSIRIQISFVKTQHCKCVKTMLFVSYETWHTVELCYNVMKGTEYFVSLYTSVVITEKFNVTVNSDKLIGTTKYLTL